MTGSIYLLQEDGTLQALAERPYANEGLLQERKLNDRNRAGRQPGPLV